MIYYLLFWWETAKEQGKALKYTTFTQEGPAKALATAKRALLLAIDLQEPPEVLSVQDFWFPGTPKPAEYVSQSETIYTGSII